MIAHFGYTCVTAVISGCSNTLRRTASRCLGLAAGLDVLTDVRTGGTYSLAGDRYMATHRVALQILPAGDQALARHYAVRAGVDPTDLGL